MPKIKQITDVENPFDPAADGIYTVEIDSAEDVISSKGLDMLKVKHRIVAAEDADNEAHVGKTLYDYNVWGGPEPSKFALFRIKQYATAAGVDPADFDAEELIGTQLEVEIRIREATDEYPASNEIKRVLVEA